MVYDDSTPHPFDPPRRTLGTRELSTRMKDLYLTECYRIKAVLDLFPVMVNAVKAFRGDADAEKLNEAANGVDSAVGELDSAMLAIERTWDPPFVPQTLRELTLMRRFALDLSAELRSGPKGELAAMRCRPIDWPND